MKIEVTSLEARLIEVHGVVQGVGFRPFVWRLAASHGVTGWVRNEGGRVTIHAEGPPPALDAFVSSLRDDAPPLAQVDDVRSSPVVPVGCETFDVDLSADVPGGERLVSPDAATCTACLGELFDPNDRRFRYPFINCTDCGPRFTIIESLPYDRGRTSMRAFPMCETCRREYEDPADRRFHAEPIACPVCGPRLRLVDTAGSPVGGDPVEEAARLLGEGETVAIKGLGGFHLACDATDPAAVGRLRMRKLRPDKPFAVMVADLDEARRWFDLTDGEAAALTSWRAPITLVRDRGELAPPVAPGHRRQGAMLPSTPLHHLLTRAAAVPLVMTSGNASDEPICVDDDDALRRLRGIAGAFLLHDREIVTRYDDSVVLVRTGDVGLSVLRRARSFAPHPIPLARPVTRPVLGVGAELHGSFCLLEGSHAFLSQHVGDLDSEEAMAAYAAAYDRACEVFQVTPEVVAHDLHPDLMTTRFAEGLGVPTVAVQHHHAHIAATMAEHGLDGEVLGVAFDGLGYGDDGTIWGGELVRCTPARSVRVGRLHPVRQPGGDAATRHPWRMALSHAAAAGVLDDAARLLGADDREVEVVLGQLRSGLASPATSSAGRLFDAVAALLGVCRHASYDGQAAMLLEQVARPEDPPVRPTLRSVDGFLEIETGELVRWVVARRTAGGAVAEIAGGFHAALAGAVARACLELHEHGVVADDRVVLGGGVFQNDLFTSALVGRLTDGGLRVFLPREVPVGDGGIALGQAYVAAASGRGSD